MSVRPARPAPRSRLALCLRAAPPTGLLVRKADSESWRDVVERLNQEEPEAEVARRLQRLLTTNDGDVEDPFTLEPIAGEFVLLGNGRAFTRESLAAWLRRSLRDRHARREVPTGDRYRVSDAEAEEAGLRPGELARLEEQDAGRTPDYSGEVSEGEDVLTAQEPRARGAGGRDYVADVELAVMWERGETAVLGDSPSRADVERFRRLREADFRRAAGRHYLPQAYTRRPIAAARLLQSGTFLNQMPPSLRRDPDFVLLATAVVSRAAELADPELMRSLDFVRKLVIRSGDAYYYAPESDELDAIADYPDGVFVDSELADGPAMDAAELQQFLEEGEFARVEHDPTQEAVVAWRSRFQADMRLYNVLVAQGRRVDLRELRTQHGRPWMAGRLVFAVAAVLSNGRQLVYASPFLQDNELVVEIAVNQAPEALQYASERLRNDVAFVRRLVLARPEAFMHAGELPRTSVELFNLTGFELGEPPPPRPAPQRQRSEIEDAQRSEIEDASARRQRLSALAARA